MKTVLISSVHVVLITMQEPAIVRLGMNCLSVTRLIKLFRLYHKVGSLFTMKSIPPYAVCLKY